jgi:uncharacterized RDD family membrane protein YckC
MNAEERIATVSVRTPEGVTFSFRIASPVLRLSALVIDWSAIMATWGIVAMMVALLRIVSSDLAGWVSAIGYFVLSLGYDIAFEWLWRGQTLGKRVLSLRVVDASGLRLTFPQVVLRNLLRAIDILPLGYLVGSIAALVTRRGQRLGDLAAGTLVIWEPREPPPDFSVLRADKYNSLRSYPAAMARLRQAVSPAEARIALKALQRRERLEPHERLRLFAELAAHFRAKTSLPSETTEGVPDEQFVRNVVDALYYSSSQTS